MRYKNATNPSDIVVYTFIFSTNSAESGKIGKVNPHIKRGQSFADLELNQKPVWMSSPYFIKFSMISRPLTATRITIHRLKSPAWLWWKMASELNGLSLILRWAWEEARSVKWVREWSISDRFVGWTTVVWSFPLTGESTMSSNRFWLSMDLNPDPDDNLLLRRRFGRSMGLLLPSSSSSPEVPSDSTFVISETWGDDDSVTGPVISFRSIILLEGVEFVVVYGWTSSSCC